MTYGLYTANNVQSMMDSGRRQAVCVARGQKTYNVATTTMGGWNNDTNYSSSPAWANIGNVILEKLINIPMTESYWNTSWKNLKYTYYVHDTGNHSGSWAVLEGPYSGWDENDTHVWCNRWHISSGTGDSYSSGHVSGTLYILVFAELPDDAHQITPDYGLQLFDAQGRCTYNSYYMPLQVHGYVTMPPFPSSTQNYSGTGIPNEVDPDRMPAVPNITVGQTAVSGGGRCHLVTCYQDKAASRGWVSIRPSGKSVGSAATANMFPTPAQWRLPIIHAADYF
ncbi:hypothetical protein L1D34_07320 [Vibrio mediterranei]|uniref:hypothetical protein n=1 Tax=Vibrio mediterranei TaxID=689 RepID=UPI001EFDD988|nr:hypothetical protein [Vibrio mediterranei]MCG9624649.1 hypothetical protein [Vibrio mediterranei]